MEDVGIQSSTERQSVGKLLKLVLPLGKIPVHYSVVGRDELINRNIVHQLPPACPQLKGETGDGATQSEDCLYATIYTPLNVPLTASLPVFVW
jgi:hypothetical protein